MNSYTKHCVVEQKCLKLKTSRRHFSKLKQMEQSLVRNFSLWAIESKLWQCYIARVWMIGIVFRDELHPLNLFSQNNWLFTLTK